jgi:uncharacterized oxidoreductase
MDLSANQVLITGGASGIGLALAQRFLAAGSDVLVCGRREDKLREAKAAHPRLRTLVANVALESGREALALAAMAELPRLNVLVNNAGIQRRMRFSLDGEPWALRHEEIAVNFEAAVHLSALLLPHFGRQARATVVNVSSGLAFVPAVFAPVYAATKAAIHSFSMSLRQELARTNIRVIEIVPPTVDTDLGGAGLHKKGVPVDAFVESVMTRIAAGEVEVGFGFSEEMRKGSRESLDEAFRRMNAALE